MEENQEILDQQKQNLVIKCLQNIISKQKNSSQISLIQCLSEFKKNPNISTLKKFLLSQNHKIAMKVLLNQYKCWKSAYRQLILIKYPQFQSVNIQQFLIGFQGIVKIDLEGIIEEYKETYRSKATQGSYNLEANKGRAKYGWSKEFVQDWRSKREQSIKLPNKITNISPNVLNKIEASQKQLEMKEKQIQIPKVSQRPDIEQPLTHDQKIESLKQCNLEKQSNLDISSSSVFKKPKKQNIKIKIGVSNGYNTRSSRLLIKQDQDTSTSKKFSKRQRKNTKRLDPIFEPQYLNQKKIVKEQPPQQKQKINPISLNNQLTVREKAISKYLDCRKDLLINLSQINGLAKYLNLQLQRFIKNILIKTIEVAKLRNEGYTDKSAGDEAKHFSKYNDQISHDMEFNLKSNKKIQIIQYPSKLQLYSKIIYYGNQQELIIIPKIQEIMNTRQEQKKITKKKQKNQHKQKKSKQVLQSEKQYWDTIFTYKADVPDVWSDKPPIQTNRLVIRNCHIMLILEDHQIFNDGIAMFMAMHY